MRWEYLTKSIPAETPADAVHRQLNELGAQGWELVAATDKLQLFLGSGQTVALLFIFKRPAEERRDGS
jgi:hypothetical protein